MVLLRHCLKPKSKISLKKKKLDLTYKAQKQFYQALHK